MFKKTHPELNPLLFLKLLIFLYFRIKIYWLDPNPFDLDCHTIYSPTHFQMKRTGSDSKIPLTKS